MSRKPTPSVNSIILLLSAQVFLIMLGLGLVTPILPLYAQSFGVGAAAVGSLVMVFGIARIVVNIPAGQWTDTFGRKRMLVLGPLLNAAGALGLAFSGSFVELLIWRVVQGAGSAVVTTAAMIAVADISSRENRGRVMSMYQGSLLLGAGAGPAFGGIMADAYGVRAPFLAFAVLTILAAIWALLRIPETRPDAAPQEASKPGVAALPEPTLRQVMGDMLRNRNFILISAVTLGIFFTRSGGQMTLLPLLGHNVLGMSESQIGLAFTLIAGCNFVALYFAGTLADRLGRKAVIVPSGLLTALSIVLFMVTGSVEAFFRNAFLLGVGTGLGGPAPAAYATDIVPRARMGPAMGLYRSISDLGLVIGPVLLGAIVDISGYNLAFGVNALILIVTTAAFAFWARETVVRAR